jgi:hypothetical protein
VTPTAMAIQSTSTITGCAATRCPSLYSILAKVVRVYVTQRPISAPELGPDSHPASVTRSNASCSAARSGVAPRASTTARPGRS